MKILEKINTSKENILRIFNITFFRKIVGENYIYYYFLGVRLYKKERISNAEALRWLKNSFYNNQVLSQVTYYHSIFAQYQRINEGKDVVIIASGPTANKYIPISNAVNIAINGAVTKNNIKFDYVFLTDFLKATPQINDIIDMYANDKCIKFYAILPQKREKVVSSFDNSGKIPPFRFYNAKAIPFLLEDVYANKWAVNLACEPFGDFGGSIFSALQFALYTHPKRIFLVGCDCTSGYCYNTNYVGDNSSKIKSFLLFKKFLDKTYPDVEVYTINPVGLKGIFREIYTKDNGNYITKNGRVIDMSKEIIL